MVEEDKPKSESDALFNELKNRTGVQPALPVNVELPEDNGGSSDTPQYNSLEERINYGKKKTDMEVVDTRLFPDLGFKHLNVIQVARVFPDSFNPLLRIMVKSLIRDFLCGGSIVAVLTNKGKPVLDEASKPIVRIIDSVAEAIALVYTALTIAIDGEGRIDEIHVFGRSAETEESKAKNSMGLP